MYIVFKNKKLKEICSNFKSATIKFGEKNAKKLIQRLNELNATEKLAIFIKLPQTGFHELKGNRKGQYAVNLIQPFRLIFMSEIDEDKFNCKLSDLEYYKQITTIKILEVKDYHD